MGYKKRSTSSKKRALTRSEIVDAAARILRRDGYEALTIRNVAAELDVKSASLYWHFETKEDLEDALADALLVGLTSFRQIGSDWKENIRSGSLHMFRHLRSIRDSGRLLAGRFQTGPSARHWMEKGLEPFVKSGLSKRDAAFASHAVHIYLQGFVIFATSPLSAMETKGVPRRTVLDTVRKTFHDLPGSTYPNIVTLADALTIPDDEARFLFGLDCILDGLEKRIAKPVRKLRR